MRSKSQRKQRGSKTASFLIRNQKTINAKKMKTRKVKIHKTFKKNNKATLYKGDCLDLLKTIPDSSVDLVVSSPPYCMGKEYESTTNVDDFQQFHANLLPEIIRVTKTGGSICWQVGYHVKNGIITPLDFYIYDYVQRNYKNTLFLRNRITWTFRHGLHCQSRFSGRHELVLWFTKGKDYEFNLDAIRIKQRYPGKTHYKGANKGKPSGNPMGMNPTDVWDIPNVKAKHIEKTVHPCQFPIGLAERFVLALTDVGDIVLDPFAGVASTGCAAVLNGRKFVGAELDADYYEVALGRLRDAVEGRLQYRPHNRPVLEPDPRSKVARDPFTKTAK